MKKAKRKLEKTMEAEENKLTNREALVSKGGVVWPTPVFPYTVQQECFPDILQVWQYIYVLRYESLRSL